MTKWTVFGHLAITQCREVKLTWHFTSNKVTYRPTTFMKRPDPNYDHNLVKLPTKLESPNLAEPVLPRNLESVQSGQLWYLVHNLKLSCWSLFQISTANMTNETVKTKHENWNFCLIIINLIDGIGNQYQQVLNAKCGLLMIIKLIYLLSLQKSTFWLTSEMNSSHKNFNFKELHK